MRETGIVIEAGSTATVRFKRTSACGRCGKCEPAGEEPGEGAMLITAVNKVGAQVGDLVTVDVSPRDALTAAALAYMVPWLGAVLGMIAGALIAPLAGLSTEIGAIMFAGVGLVGAYGVVAMLDRRAGQSNRFKPIVTSIMTRSTPAYGTAKTE